MLKLTLKNLLNSYINTLLLIISLIVAILSFSVGVGYINYFYQSEMDKAILSKESDKISINLKESINVDGIVDFLSSNTSSNIISGEFPLMKNNKRIFLAGVNFEDPINIDSLPLYSGKPFTQDEASQSSKVALVGYAHKDLTFALNGENFIELEGEQYKVVGYIGRDTNSYWNGSVLVPIKSLPSSIRNQKISNIEYLFFNKLSSKEETLRAKEYFSNIYASSSILDSFSNESLSKILYSKRSFLTSIGLLIAISITNIFNFAYNWCKKNIKQFSILVLLGYRKNQLVLILFLSLLFIVISSFVVAILLNISLEGVLSDIFAINIKFKSENFYTGSIFASTMLSLCLIFNYVYITRANLASELRR